MEEILLKNAALVIGALFTAMIAGFFAFINLISSKEQKVSEFRQDWINQLRDAISEYISSLSYLSILYKHHLEQDGVVTPIDLLMVKFTFYKRSNNLIVHLFAFRKTNGFSY
ncbi:hypothetical protein PDPE_1-02656 [Photobacterium damselae subsp. piscicida]|nr:hypothetical protein BEI67_08225 [Photobacterium damselae subsp. piscicida]BBC41815.1 hypothetical protein PDPE_1-02656 [Photobacterium damselae subsp. piscicida]